jgi:hypothetical protein
VADEDTTAVELVDGFGKADRRGQQHGRVVVIVIIIIIIIIITRTTLIPRSKQNTQLHISKSATPVDSLEVQVIRRLVQQQQMRLLRRDPRERDLPHNSSQTITPQQQPARLQLTHPALLPVAQILHLGRLRVPRDAEAADL